MTHKKLQDIDPIERPREKLMRYGASRLTTSELIAILIGSGTKQKNVVDVAQGLLKSLSSKELVDMPANELKKKPGLGPASACRIAASIELGKRLIHNKETELLLTPHDVWNSLKHVRSNRKEHVIIFYLDSRNQTIERETISIGTVDKTVVHPREVFEPAIRNNASSVLLAHNHPTGNAEPSEHDIILTQRLVSAGDILGIEVIDHVIVTKHTYISMKEMGLV